MSAVAGKLTMKSAPIERVYVLCHARDLWLAKISVMSVRYWDRAIPITLIKDRSYGDFDTGELERCCGATVLVLENDRCGLGFAKLELLVRPIRERFLVLDADTVMCGPVVASLTRFREDFIVPAVPVDNPRLASFTRIYYDPDLLGELDPRFHFPGFAFNTGVFVGTSGLIARAVFDPHLRWGSPVRLRAPQIFSCSDQGLLNYLLVKLAGEGAITMASARLMTWGFAAEAKRLNLKRIVEGRGYDFVLHYAGAKPGSVIEFPAPEVLLHFDRLYHRRAAGWDG